MVQSSQTKQAVKKQAIKQKPTLFKGGYSFFMALLVLGAIVVGIQLFYSTEQPEPASTNIEISAPDINTFNAPQLAPTVGAIQIKQQASLPQYRVGIVSGHKGYDPGAVCDDGLTEATVNYNVAVEVVNLLSRKGIQTDLLDEFDDRLTGYQADALVSIHADSCNILGATGFKVARITDSAIPEAEDYLVGCLNQEYGRYTGLPQHYASITDNMTNYHAFREIDHQTPGAIIEMGFMLDDRYLLEQKPKILARGIAAGILCFLHR